MIKRICVTGMAIILGILILLQAPITVNIAFADPPPPPKCDDCK